MKKSLKYTDLIIPIMVAIFNVVIILFPRDIISASKEGLSLWFNNVFPSLLPFIIGTNILTSLGVVTFLGTLLEPIMYTLFGVPGVGGFALITGMTSGYPMGAKVTADLREKNELTLTEAQRLVSFVNNSGPLFVIGAVGIGMYNSTEIGYFLLISHYFAAIITGIIFRYYKHSEKRIIKHERRILSKAYNNMRNSRMKDGRPLGVLLGNSIKNAMETIAQIGGFIILFCVIVKVIDISGIVDLLASMFKTQLEYLGINAQLFKGLITGILEITNGTKILSVAEISKAQLVLNAAIISFGGLSINAQAFNFLGKTDINGTLYIAAKFLHACIAAVIASLIFPIFKLGLNKLSKPENAVHTFSFIEDKFINKLAFSTFSFILSIAAVILIVIGINLKSIVNRKKY